VLATIDSLVRSDATKRMSASRRFLGVCEGLPLTLMSIELGSNSQEHIIHSLTSLGVCGKLTLAKAAL
jgi:hypothetical protein